MAIAGSKGVEPVPTVEGACNTQIRSIWEFTHCMSFAGSSWCWPTPLWFCLIWATLKLIQHKSHESQDLCLMLTRTTSERSGIYRLRKSSMRCCTRIQGFGALCWPLCKSSPEQQAHLSFAKIGYTDNLFWKRIKRHLRLLITTMNFESLWWS